MDLSLVPIEDLIAEIDKRSDTNVILTHKFNGDHDQFDWHLHGNRMTVIGLLTLALDKTRGDFGVDETGEFYKD